MLARSSARTCTAWASTVACAIAACTPLRMSATLTDAPMAADAPWVMEMPSAPVAVTMRLASCADTDTTPASARSFCPAVAPVLSMMALTSEREMFTPTAPAPPSDLPPAPATVMLNMLLLSAWPCVSEPMSSEISPPDVMRSTAFCRLMPPVPVAAPSFMAMPSRAFSSELAS